MFRFYTRYVVRSPAPLVVRTNVSFSASEACANRCLPRRAGTDSHPTTYDVSCTTPCTPACSTDASCTSSTVSSTGTCYSAPYSARLPACAAIVPASAIVLCCVSSCQDRGGSRVGPTNSARGIYFVSCWSLYCTCCPCQHLLDIELATQVGGSVVVGHTCRRRCQHRCAGEYAIC